MAGVFGAHLMSYLRLLTPYEVDKLTSLGEKREKVELTQLIMDEQSDLTAKPFVPSAQNDGAKNKKQEKEQEEDPKKKKTRKIVQVKEKKAKDRLRPPTKEKFRFDMNAVEKQSLSDFLLDQKMRMNACQKKLKQKEVLDMYNDTNKYEVSKHVKGEKKNDSGVDLNSSVGVLVDKKTG